MARSYRTDSTQSDGGGFMTIPLKNAPIVSLRALENGNEDDVDQQDSFWSRLLMPLRIRKHDKQPISQHEPLLNGDTKVPAARHLATSPWTPRLSRVCIAIPFLVLAFFGAVHLVNVGLSLVPMFWDDEHPFLPEWGEPGKLGEGLASYPTDFTRDVIPINCHSHNDYWRRVPLYQALHYGCTGVEADVWLFDNELYVGHNTISLTRNRTFRSLYVDPIVEILDHQNPSTEFGNATRNGVFDEDPQQTLVLLVDFKTSGESLWPVVIEQLSALREKNYLTFFDGHNVTSGPVTVVATGNARFDLLTSNTTYRDIFFDAPLADMFEEPTGGFPEPGPFHKNPPSFSPSKIGTRYPRLFRRSPGQGSNGVSPDSSFDETNSYYASVSFHKSIGRIWGGRMSSHQMRLIRGQIQGAKRRGLKVRYWNTPNWPIGLRNHVWDVLVREGVDYLNVDDLRAATRANWNRKNHHGWL